MNALERSIIAAATLTILVSQPAHAADWSNRQVPATGTATGQIAETRSENATLLSVSCDAKGGKSGVFIPKAVQEIDLASGAVASLSYTNDRDQAVAVEARAFPQTAGVTFVTVEAEKFDDIVGIVSGAGESITVAIKAGDDAVASPTFSAGGSTNAMRLLTDQCKAF